VKTQGKTIQTQEKIIEKMEKEHEGRIINGISK
jgi:hypothetical protein